MHNSHNNNNDQRLNDHQKFKEMAALAQGRDLTISERIELKRHLESCEACRAISTDYALLSSRGMDFLAAELGHVPQAEAWDHRAVHDNLLSRIREFEQSQDLRAEAESFHSVGFFSAWSAGVRWAAAAAAACLMIAVGTGAYHLGSRRAVQPRISTTAAPSSASAQFQQISLEKKSADDLVSAQTVQIARLQRQIFGEQRDLAGLRAALRLAENKSNELSDSNSKGEAQYRQVTEERDRLAGELRDAEKAYQSLQLEFASLRAQHERALLHTASLESKIDELSVVTRDQDRKLKDNEQYLSSDRDIRELMGARKLYIADVFDVDSGSNTRKPFGRVFYTQNKSLVFYAFDLDHEPGVKNASAFQVWGQRDAELTAKSRPMNLGILYMDSETNRRWVLRWDDPKQLEEIDAVFVTVEPHGGSQKPTGKPFLYALLRKEANHP
ncbi:MAG TPA: hypothetical protein VNW47_01495 [Terriglobales bacterium]|nr:hypothetical protein [Terriglobales bacterium]